MTETTHSAMVAGEADRAVWSTVLYAFFLAFSLGVVSVGWRLEPDARGYGTHEQLGLPPCAMPRLFGFPCPTCGFTTSLALMCRLQPVRAVRTHPLGAVVFAAAWAFLLWTAAALLRGRNPMAIMRLLRSAWCWGTVIALFYVSWFLKIGVAVLHW